MSVYPLHIYIVIRVTGVVKQEAGHEFLHLGSVICRHVILGGYYVIYVNILKMEVIYVIFF